MKKSIAATALVLALGTATLAVSPAQATSDGSSGTTSLAEVLAADGQAFDHDAHDFDILEAAVYAVLEAKPDSAVGVLADGTVPLTAFLPSDRAFRRLVADLTGERIRSEEQIFGAVAGLGIDTVEAVLLYHVVPGQTLDSGAVVAAKNSAVDTALAGNQITIKVFSSGVYLRDNDPDDKNPRALVLDINQGNAQIAHGINRVLRPIDL